MKEQTARHRQAFTRRAVLRNTSLFIAGATGTALSGCTQLGGAREPSRMTVRVGLLTDVHYADKETHGTRHYRDSLTKISSAVDRLNEAKPDLAIELGDFIDSADSVDREIGHLKRIESLFARVRCPRHHVLGNHCVHTLTKAQFLAEVGMIHSYYSFDVGGFHFVVLDACFRHDGEPYGLRNFEWTDANIPPAELDWLASDLQSTRNPTVVFVHQRLDVANHYGIRNQVEVREHLEASGRVLAVLQGHNHLNDLRELRGIHYVTLAAMVEGPVSEGNAYGLMELLANGSIRIDGFGHQEDRQFA